MLRPSISRGRPAFGCADSFTVATCAIRSIVSSIAAGPTLQLRPTIWRRDARAPARTLSGAAPSRLLPSSSVVTCATIGSSQTLRTARIAAPISLTSRKVSSTKRSTPPSTSARACSRKNSSASSTPVLPHGSMRIPSGPIAPATYACSRAACRAMLRPLQVDRVHPVGKAERAELDAIGTERVRFDDVGAGAHVGLVHLGDQIRLRQVQLVERAVQEDALRVQHRPHRAVADEHALVERFEKGGLRHG